jgi:hypothetical protein
MGLKQLIQKPVPEMAVVVHYDGKDPDGSVFSGDYTIRGRPDADKLGAAIMITPTQKGSMLSKLKGNGYGSFSDNTLRQLILVQKTLVPDPSDFEGPNAIVPEEYDILWIGALAKNYGDLFMMLVAPAMEVLGLKDRDLASSDPSNADADIVIQAALPNSSQTPAAST